MAHKAEGSDGRCDSHKEEDRKIRLGEKKNKEKIMENDKWGL